MNEKCLQCGTKMRTTRENHRYTASGLPNVTLVNVEISRCPNCGEFEVAIPRIEELHRVIAFELISKRQRLTAAEIRYLRKYLGLSANDFAARIGVDRATVSRWESESSSQPMNTQAERLLRLMVAHEKPAEEYPAAKLADVATEDAKDIRLRIDKAADGWHAKAA